MHIDRTHRARRRLGAPFALGAGAVLLAAGLVVAASPVPVDLSTLNASADVNGAVLQQSNFEGSTGTGVFDSFVRIQQSGTEQGYNTSGRPVQYNELTSPFTRDLLLSEVPLVDRGGTMYREFRLDINEVDSTDEAALLSLDKVRLFVSTTASIASADPSSPTFGQPAGTTSLVWDLDGDGDTYVKLNYSLAPGSGNGDMYLYVPDADFGPAATDCGYGEAGCGYYVYLYSSMGAVHTSSDGFEEWSVRKANAVAADKTANPAWTRTNTWEITKDVDPEEHALFIGDEDSSAYEVDVTRTVTDSDFLVTGQITIANEGAKKQEGIWIRPADITDAITLGGNPVTTGTITTCTYDGAGVALTSWVTVVSPNLLICQYTADLGDDADLDTWYANTALIDYYEGNNANQLTKAGTLTAYEEFAFTLDNATVVGPDEVDVTDEFGDADPETLQSGLAASDTFDYNRDFACSTDLTEYTDGHYQYTVPNTAKLLDGETVVDFAEASVTVDCYAPVVSKDATATFDREWDWTLEKVGDHTELTLSIGQTFLVNYDVTVSATKTDSNWKVAGDIDVENPHPTAAMTVDLADVITPGSLAASITGCEVDGSALTQNVDDSWTIPAGKTAVCGYEYEFASDPGTDTYTNTATATLNEVDVDGTADFAFDEDDPTTETDECIDVTDDQYGSLGQVCAGDSPTTFEYSLNVGPYAVCGTYTFDNTASFVTNDTGATGSEGHSVAINVPCQGCTLTQGYWKTHSSYGPAPYDDAWLNLGPLGADTLFFNTGKTWYEVFWTSPAGNAFYNLAHQYMAAKLNILDGTSSTTEVNTAIADAEALFNAQGAGDTTLSNPERRTALRLATILDDYNNGLIGPGHCSE